MRLIAIRADDECNAPEWWAALREKYPVFAGSLARNGCADIDPRLWDTLANLPGWDCGPDYANVPILDMGEEGSGWGDVVAQRHGIFTELE